MAGSLAFNQSTETVLIETCPCPICNKNDYQVLKPAQYPVELDIEQLFSIYRSSTNHELMDQLVRCNNCDLVYLNPRIKEEIVIQAYAGAKDPVFFEQNPERIATFRRVFNGLIKKFDINVRTHNYILDVGCAGGSFLKVVADMGFRSLGIEPSAWLCDQGRRTYGLDLRQGTLDDFEIEDETFDIISFWDVVEHLADPVSVLSKARKMLKETGYLLINYPDYASLARKLMGSYWPFFLNAHLYYFTPKTLELLLNKCGFKLITHEPFWQTLRLGYCVERAQAVVKFPSSFTKVLNATPLARLPLRYNMGQTLVVAGPL